MIGVSAVDTAKDVLAQTDQNIKRTADTVVSQGSRVESASTSMAARFRANAASIMTTAAGLGAGIVGFATSFDTLERAQVAAGRANLVYEKSLDRLKEMHEEGKVSAQEYANQEEAVRLNAEKAKLTQDALGDTYTNFLANVPSQLISFGVAANGIYTMLRTQQTATSVSSVTSGATYTGALASMSAANVQLQVSTMSLSAVMKAAFLSNPITLPLVIIAGLITAIAFNVGGLRDRFFELGKAIYDFFVQYFKPLADAMAWFYNNVLKPIGSFMGGAGLESAEAYSGGMADLGEYTTVATESTAELKDYMQELAQQTADTRDENLNYLQSIGKLDLALGLTNDRLSLMTNYLKDTEREQQQLVQDSFDLVAGTYGVQFALNASNDQLIQMASNLKEVQAQTRTTISSFTELKQAQDNLSGNTESAGVTYSRGSDFRATGELGKARQKYAGLDLVKVGSNWQPADLLDAKRDFMRAQDSLSMFKRNAGAIDTRFEVERLAELQQNVDSAKARYAQELINVQIVVNQNGSKTESVDTEVTSSRNRQLRTRRQVLAGAG